MGAKRISSRIYEYKENKIHRCMYCGAEIEWIRSNNPDDGLHNIISKYDTNGQVCCSNCNIITGINRTLCRVIDNPEDFDIAVYHLNNYISELESNKGNLIKYYMRHKQDRERLLCENRKQSLISSLDLSSNN